MFEKIAILPKDASNYPLDIGMMAEKMLYYKDVIVFAGRRELELLFEYFDIDVLVEYLKRGHIRIVNRSRNFGVGLYGKTYMAEFFIDTKYDLKKIIYEAYYSFSKDVEKSKKAANTLYKYIGIYETPPSVKKEINQDVADPEFLKKSLIQSAEHYYPQGAPDLVGAKLIVEPQADGSLAIESNIDLQKYPAFDPSSLVLNIGTALENTKIASDYGSEIAAPDLNSRLISVKLNSVIEKTTKSKKDIEVFQYAQFSEGPSLQKVINEKHKTMADFLEVLKAGEKFKDWLTDLGEDNKLIKEYTAKMNEKTWIQTVPAKSVRFYLVQGLSTILKVGVGGLAGIAAGIGLSAVNTFLVDRLGKGWRPHHYIEKKVIPFVEGKEK
jgi:hypothetical protein